MYKQPTRPWLPQLKKLTDEDDSLYLLDWKPKEKRNLQNEILDGSGGLFPKQHLDWLYQLRFVMPNYYVKEIAYQCKKGQEEWSRMWPEDYCANMDTCVREKCLKPAQAHFDVAFYLLSDCVYDPLTKKKNWEVSYLAKCMMLTYFWDGQTGGGLLMTKSGADDLLDKYCAIYSEDKVKRQRSDYWHLAVDFVRALANNIYGDNQYYMDNLNKKIEDLFQGKID